MADNFLGSFAEGIDRGARLAYAGRQITLAEQQQQAEQEAKKQAMQAEQAKLDYQKFEKTGELLAKVPKSLIPAVWPTFANSANKLFDSGLDPMKPPTQTQYLKDLGVLIQQRRDGHLSQDDFLHLTGELRTQMEKDENEQAGKILDDLPEIKGTKITPGATPFSLSPVVQDGKPLAYDKRTNSLIPVNTPEGTNAPIVTRTEQTKVNEELKNLATQKANLDQTLSLLDKIPDGFIKGGGLSVASSLTFGGVGSDAKLYNDNKGAAAVAFYRASTGDTRLSDADAKSRALPLLPDLSEPKELRNKKILYMQKKLQDRQQLLSNGYSGVIDFDTGKPIEVPGANSSVSPSAQSVIEKLSGKR